MECKQKLVVPFRSPRVVVESFSSSWQSEELRQAFQKALSSELSLASPLHAAQATEAQLRKAAEAIAYEDWAVDYKNVSKMSRGLHHRSSNLGLMCGSGHQMNAL